MTLSTLCYLKANKIVSAAEELTGEMRRLALKCKSLEAKLVDSIPKKTHNETVSKMQSAIDASLADLARTKQDLEQTESLGGRLNALTSHTTELMERISSQGELIKSLESKIAEGTVPIEVYNQSLSRIHQLEDEVSSRVRKEELDLALEKNAEFERQILGMVRKEEYESALARVSELESLVANYVPKSDVEELTEQIMSITKMVSPPIQESTPELGELEKPSVADTSFASVAETSPQ